MAQIKIITSEQLELALRKLIREEIAFLAKEANPSPEYEPYLTLDDACAFLGKARSTLYALTSKNKIPFHKQGKKLYFKKSELIDWIESKEDGK